MYSTQTTKRRRSTDHIHLSIWRKMNAAKSSAGNSSRCRGQKMKRSVCCVSKKELTLTTRTFKPEQLATSTTNCGQKKWTRRRRRKIRKIQTNIPRAASKPNLTSTSAFKITVYSTIENKIRFEFQKRFDNRRDSNKSPRKRSPSRSSSPRRSPKRNRTDETPSNSNRGQQLQLQQQQPAAMMYGYGLGQMMPQNYMLQQPGMLPNPMDNINPMLGINNLNNTSNTGTYNQS